MTDPRLLWRKHKAEGAADITIGLAGSMTLDPMVPYLGAHLLGRGFKNPKIVSAEFNQLHQACRDPKGAFGDAPDAIFLIWRLEDMFPDMLDRPADVLAAVSGLAQSVATLRRNFSGTIIVSAPPYPSLPAFDPTALEQPVTGGALHRGVLEAWMESIAGIERVRVLDLHGLLLKAGSDTAFDARKWFLYRQPWSESFWAAVGRQAGRILSAETVPAKKCLVLDADNTLWGGIIGEDGMEGIDLGDDFPGSAFRAFQKYALYLKQKGILLAVASKNNEADFYEMFDGHDAMILKRDDVAAFEVHWESKVESLRRIAQKLNIGTDSLVFVDDSAKEIAEVRERLPEVTCVMAPEELADLPGVLTGLDLFDLAEVTDEDRNRAAMMAVERKRENLQETMSEAEFKAQLGLEMSVFRTDKRHIARVAQLINKSNQFNLTTRRRPQGEIETLARDEGWRVLGMELKDKYGDYGLVGAAVLEKRGRVCVIDTLLMSCRVLGRDAETSFIAQLAEAAKRMGCETVQGRYIPTPKNGMVKGLYAAHGFAYDERSDVWTAGVDAVTKAPAHTRIRNTA